MSRIIKIFNSLSFSEKKKFFLLIILYCISSLSDLIGVISIFPFLAVLSDNSIIYNNYYINILYEYLNIKIDKFLILLGFLSLTILIFNQLLRIISNWYLNFFFEKYYYNIASKTYKELLNKDYLFHLKTNSTVNSQKILFQIGNVVTGFLSPIVLIIVNIITSIFMLSFLMYYNYQLTIAIICLYLFYYSLIILLFKNKLNKYGETIPNYFSNASKIVSDSFNGIKEIKLLNKNKFFESRFNPILKQYNLARVKSFLFQLIPHSLLEIFTFSVVLIIVFYFYSPTNISLIIPTLGILALALKRLQPTITTIYNSLVQIRIYYPTFNDIYEEVFKEKSIEINRIKQKYEIDDFRQLNVNEISFKYNSNSKFIFENFNFIIKKQDKIGIYGESGCGKSTLIDLFLGLLKPQSGSIFLNNKNTNKFYLNYENSIGYASHNGFIFDGSFIENITLDENTNYSFKELQKITKIIKTVCLERLLREDLNNNFHTKIGENGVKLSTGQNQRLVLARMLYNEPSFIILDEATNALDKETENIILNNIFKEYSHKTLLLISHDIDILKKCNEVYELKNGFLSKIKSN